MKTIYIVTTMKLGYKYRNINRSTDGYYHYYRKRTNLKQKKVFSILSKTTVGWYSKLEYAQKCIEINDCDIHELDQDYAVIEKIAEGTYSGCTIPKEWWYKWKGKPDKGKYVPTSKPKKYDRIICFYGNIEKRKTL